MECLKPGSTVLADIGLALLKFVSSHRGLTYVPRLMLPYAKPHLTSTDLRYSMNILEDNTLLEPLSAIHLATKKSLQDSWSLTFLQRLVLYKVNITAFLPD